MSKKQSAKTTNIAEDENMNPDYNVCLSHSDFSSVCFNLEENAALLRDLTACAPKSDDENAATATTCNCLKFVNDDRGLFTCACDNNFITEYYGSICAPALNLFYEQGAPPNYYYSNCAGHNLWGSSSHYLSIYDHAVAEHRRGHLYHTAPLAAIIEWDNPRREPHFFRFEHIDFGALFYRQFFYGHDHVNYVGFDNFYGPFCISIMRTVCERKINSRDCAARKTIDNLSIVPNTNPQNNTLNPYCSTNPYNNNINNSINLNNNLNVDNNINPHVQLNKNNKNNFISNTNDVKYYTNPNYLTVNPDNNNYSNINPNVNNLYNTVNPNTKFNTNTNTNYNTNSNQNINNRINDNNNSFIDKNNNNNINNNLNNLNVNLDNNCYSTPNPTNPNVNNLNNLNNSSNPCTKFNTNTNPNTNNINNNISDKNKNKNKYNLNNININDKQYFSAYRVIARFINIYNFRGVISAAPQEACAKNKGVDRILISSLFPRLNPTQLNTVTDKQFHDELLKFDEEFLVKRHKVGVVYCAPYQTTESEIYSNNIGSLSYQSFLELLGDKIVLKNFEGFAGMLDTKTDISGTHSLYTKFKDREIMFHVSTLIPGDPNDSQQITRKRYIGNDMVTIVFQDEGSRPFSPKSFISQFQHVYIVIQSVMRNDKLVYRLAVIRLKDVPCFGPYITQEYYIPDTYFRHFLLTKIINAEYACQKANKFIKLNRRTRYQMLLELKRMAESVQVESSKSNRFVDLFKKNEKIVKYNHDINKNDKYINKCTKNKLLNCLEPYLLNDQAVVWQGSIFNPSYDKYIDCVIAVSIFCTSVISTVNKEIILTILNKYLLAFKFITPVQVKIYHRAGNFFIFKFNKDDTSYVSNFLNRLTAVSNITEAQIITFKPPVDKNDFIIDDYAIVRKVPSNQSGMNKLNIGDQILEIESISLSVLTLKKFIDILFEGGWKRLMVAQMKAFAPNYVPRTLSLNNPFLNNSLRSGEKENSQLRPYRGGERNIDRISDRITALGVIDDIDKFAPVIIRNSKKFTRQRCSSIGYFDTSFKEETIISVQNERTSSSQSKNLKKSLFKFIKEIPARTTSSKVDTGYLCQF